jgi:MarR family transcriptional regulator, organic hydroperoxide resistance regulator
LPTLSSAPLLAARGDSPADAPGALLERVATAWHQQLRAALVALDLTPAQFRLLIAAAWLNTRQTGVRQSDISTHANADAVMTSEVLRSLEARGLISRAPHTTDRRAKAITITDAGGALADRAIRLVDTTESRFFEIGLVHFGALAKALKKGGRGSDRTDRW